jgi:hypothetical protein
MKQAGDLPRQQANTLDAVFGQHLVRQLYVVWAYGRRATQVGLSFGFGVITPRLRVKELQLIMEAFLVTHSPHPVQQVRKKGLYVRRMKHDPVFRKSVVWVGFL